MISITINGKIHEYDAKPNVEKVLTDLSIRRDNGIAVALNHSVLSRQTFASTYLEDGDKIEVIHATAGG